MLQYQIVLIPFDIKIIEIKAIKKKKKETVASSHSIAAPFRQFGWKSRNNDYYPIII